jgi:hypothetical protein
MLLTQMHTQGTALKVQSNRTQALEIITFLGYNLYV